MDTTPISREGAAAIEAAEARAWTDLYRAAPAAFAGAAGLATVEIGGALVLRWAASGRRYFSRTIGLGTRTPATPAVLDEILDLYERSGIRMFLLQSLPQCAPAGYDALLCHRGLDPFDAQDRIVRDSRAVAAAAEPGGRELLVERVDPATTGEWVAFVERVYRLQTGNWLRHLVGRPGWHQYVAREDGELVATRSMFVGERGMTWMGMDGPVPGITTEDYEPDAAICERMVRDGPALGVTSFIADIEAPSAALDTPSYAYFSRLGFRRPYVRTHYARGVS